MKTTAAKNLVDAKIRRTEKSRIDRPEKFGKPQMKWGSDVVAEVTRRLDLKYIALVPGASYRGFHDSIVNYLGNQNPQMVICLHEEHAVSIADGYGKVTEEPMAVALHSNVGLMHASMPIFNAWCDRTPMIIFGATGPVDAHRRRPWIDWIHTSKDQASMIRNYIKWDDQPASPQAAVEVGAAGQSDHPQRAQRPGLYLPRRRTSGGAAYRGNVSIPDPARFAPAPSPAVPRDISAQGTEGHRQGEVSVDSHGARVAPAGGLGSPRTLCRDDRRRSFDQQQRPSFLSDHSSAASCRALFASEQSCDRPDRESRSDHQHGLARSCAVSFAWLSAQRKPRQPADKTIIHCSVDSYRTNGWSMDHQALRGGRYSDPRRARSIYSPRCSTRWTPRRRRKIKTRPEMKNIVALERRDRRQSPQAANGKSMTLWDMAMTVREFAKKRPVTFARLSIGWPGEADEFDGPLSFLGNDGGGAVGTGPGHYDRRRAGA